MKRMASALIAAAAAIGLAATVAAQPVKIGYSIAKTGLFAQGAVSQSNAFDLWREQVNARCGLDIGGKGKRPVEFVEGQSFGGGNPRTTIPAGIQTATNNYQTEDEGPKLLLATRR